MQQYFLQVVFDEVEVIINNGVLMSVFTIVFTYGWFVLQ